MYMVSVNLKGKKEYEGKRKREKRRKKTEKSTDEVPLGESAFLQIIPLFSLLSSNFLMLDKGGGLNFSVF